MSKCVVLAAAVLASCVGVTDANAQWAPLDGRLIVSISGIGQGGSTELNRETAFDLYDESATVTFAQSVDTGGGFVDLGASLKVIGNLGVGIAYTASTNTGEGSVTAKLPHPLFFDRPRDLTTTVGDLSHRLRTVHLQAVWFIPFTAKTTFAISAGPSWFFVRQTLIGDLTFEEVPPAFNSVTVTGIGQSTASEKAVGFNVGGDATYEFTRMIGVGGMVRYTHGTADFDLGEGQTAPMKLGTVQIGAGIRLRF